MPADRPPAAHRPPWRARVGARLQCERARIAARLRSERGDTLIEVIVSALMVALIATASLGGFADLGALSQSERSENQAAALAQQDQARLRGLTITQLSATGTGTGNTSYTNQVGGTTYTVTSKSQFISGSTGVAACAGGSADEVQTTSTVTWSGGKNGGHIPVIVHGLITPTEGGSITAVVDTLNGLVTGSTGAGAVGATISLSGPTTVTPVTVDSSGCAVFSGLDSGSYTVSYTMPPTGTWILYSTGATTIPTQTLTVSASQTTPATTVYLATPGSVQANFQTTYNGQTVTNESDTFVLSNPQLVPSTQVFGTDSTKTNNAFAATVTTPTTIFPFSSAMANSYLYTAYPGGCSADAPTGANAPQGFTVNSGTTPTAVTLPEPAMIILPYSGTPNTPSFTYDDPASTNVVYSPTTAGNWTHNSVASAYNGTESDSGTSTSDKVTVTIPLGTTSFTYYATTKSSFGNATVALTGQSNQTKSLYSATTTYKVPIYTSPALNPLTQYTLTITVTGTKPTGSTGTNIDIDEIAGTSATTYTPVLLTTKPTVTLTDTGCSNNEDWPPTQVPNATWGALQYPGVPYGNYSVCVDDGSNHVTQTVANTNWAGTIVTADIYPGVTGYGTGTCP